MKINNQTVEQQIATPGVQEKAGIMPYGYSIYLMSTNLKFTI
jgi:hypothetical protein